ncbi:interleukin-1 receptor type 2 isoform X2 [Ictalurus furcatus]|uniref:interleukin-1 receptor type 2 isoform X2 n=1 Tax=Ictalurus furcatus TaxID=66913 RepID=UPI002350BF7B|nr:interleukin-1 receptor type 2 isoform X2 [Ictalurus furcatus]
MCIYLCMSSSISLSLCQSRVLCHHPFSLILTFTMMTFISQCVVGFCVWIILSCGLNPGCAVPVKAGCEVIGEEIEDFHAQGEAMAITFPFLEANIWYRNLPVDNSTTFQLFHSKRHDLRNQGHRVIQEGRALWLLPSLPSDSGTYTYVFSSDTFCLTGSFTMTIYEKGREDMEMMSHPVSAKPDKNLTIECPHINHFNRLESPRWFKGFHAGVPLKNGTRYEISSGDALTIRNVSAEDEGLYTCWLTVIFNNAQYNVSRTWKLQVLSPVTSVPESHTEPTTKSQDVTLTSSNLLPPHITTPVNGSVIESRLGSSLVIQCKAFVGDRSPVITELNWLVDGQSVESSHLHDRAFQESRRVSAGHVEALLVFLEVYEEDTRAKLKCVAENLSGKREVVIQIKLEDSMLAWLVVAPVASCFFMLVVCVFLHLLCRKQHKHNDYILARQNSTF